jgi:hypothetical protein
LAAGAGAGGIAAERFCINSSVCMITGGGDATGDLLNCSKAALASVKTWGFAGAPGRVCASTSYSFFSTVCVGPVAVLACFCNSAISFSRSAASAGGSEFGFDMDASSA